MTRARKAAAGTPRGAGHAAGRGAPRGPGRGRSLVALALVGFVLVAVGVIWRRSTGFAHQRVLRTLEQRRTQLEGERAKLELEIRDVSSRTRLVPIAEQRLHMRYPNDSQVVYLARGTAASQAAHAVVPPSAVPPSAVPPSAVPPSTVPLPDAAP